MRYKSIIAATLAAATLFNAPVAQATPETDFLSGLNSHGITIVNANRAVNAGWAICAALDNHNGADVAEAFYRITGWEVPTRDVAAVWVIEAAQHLCPWQIRTRSTGFREGPPPEPADVPISGGLGGRIG